MDAAKTQLVDSYVAGYVLVIQNYKLFSKLVASFITANGEKSQETNGLIFINYFFL